MAALRRRQRHPPHNLGPLQHLPSILRLDKRLGDNGEEELHQEEAAEGGEGAKVEPRRRAAGVHEHVPKGRVRVMVGDGWVRGGMGGR